MYSHEALTPADKAQLHRTRFELGQQMARHLAQRSLSETHDITHDREAVGINDMRQAVWRAEYDALQADPQEKFLPLDIRQSRGQTRGE